mmetsp:Transcript_21449/g.32569  ORF Transcript_21449/g.32569 Transcript_21449/m.32569 type:complete len:222 (-) Transcript_21449:185-850(-)
MVENSDVENHYLNDFLQQRLPDLGLDFETYGSYVIGLVDDEEDADWEGIMELLQASSESHSDDDNVWAELKNAILKYQEEHKNSRLRREEELKQERMKEDQERLQEEIALAKQAEIDGKKKKEIKHEVDDAKRSLVERFAYDESEQYDNDGKLIGTSNVVETVVSNKDAAMQAHQEKAKEMRSNQKSSKREEQAKTTQSKRDKMQQKEERRNRAQKGERKR